MAKQRLQSQSARPKSANPARAESKPKPPAPYNTVRRLSSTLGEKRSHETERQLTKFRLSQLFVLLQQHPQDPNLLYVIPRAIRHISSADRL